MRRLVRRQCTIAGAMTERVTVLARHLSDKALSNSSGGLRLPLSRFCDYATFQAINGICHLKSWQADAISIISSFRR
jgi:hypothetical protein